MEIVANFKQLLQYVNYSRAETTCGNTVPILNFIYSKGQLISECPFEILNFPKIPPKIRQISALESKKWSNHKIKALSYLNIYDQICYLMY